jgi:hypothetical protein
LGNETIILLALGTVVYHKNMIELMLTATAEVSSMLFEDTQGDVINSEDYTDAEHGFTKYDKQHQSGIPFAGF